ncbi:efflux RND transporter periplasmic adaptor subunit [Cryobacterium breve]|uniref:Efflux RND transporter periplasmic adaptor subunit n=1 Tax=Cryobacterium breve TaxID=1259258 RepID=A0ABY7N8L8_9MICO|nr:efflux RND transporter periplasmic adaptor subunit [Cryobacterium breve]WBM78841.1 efflux RND transporter periplasmic adaptor subunit [Cryobacterium breve]
MGGLNTSSTTTVASAETIVADRADIAAAEAQLAIARKQTTLTTLTAPFAGTVAAVAIVAGDAVSAASNTAVITILGNDGYVVNSTVSLSRIASLTVGQTAKIELATTGTALTGVVSSIGILNVSTSSTPKYAVTLAVDTTDATILTGASAHVTVAIESTDAVLTVPTSAVHRDGSAYTVDVLAAGASTSTTVTVGAVGTELTEIDSGLAAGDVVILADLDDAIPGTAADTSSSLTDLGGSSGGSSADFQGGPPSGDFSGFSGGTPPQG